MYYIVFFFVYNQLLKLCSVLNVPVELSDRRNTCKGETTVSHAGENRAEMVWCDKQSDIAVSDGCSCVCLCVLVFSSLCVTALLLHKETAEGKTYSSSHTCGLTL